MTCAIIVQIKDENRYLDEWITYHKMLGVNHIFIIDNNNIDGENPHDIIDKYDSYITYINDRGNRNKEILQKNYINTYHQYKDDYDWFIFIDVDEFIILNKYTYINDYLNSEIFNNVEQIHLNWVIYDDNDLIYDDPSKSVMHRFTRRMEPDLDKEYPLYNLCKSILRGGKHIDEHRLHNIINYNHPFVTVDNIGNTISQEDGSSIHDETYCYINHYMTKSLEEFIYKKYNKDDGSHTYQYDFEKGFFIINKHTEEKDKYIDNFLNSKITPKKDIKYTVIICLFGYYDTLKEPEEVDPNAEYICVTDRTDLTSNVWRFIHDEEYDNYEIGIQKAFAYKYKNIFKYISPKSKYVIRLDSSIIIHKSLSDIIKYIDDNNYDCCLMIHPERRDMIDEYNVWQTLRMQDPVHKDTFIRKMSNLGFNINDTGLIETTIQIYKISDNIKCMVNDIKDIIQETSNFTDNNDQCYYTYILSKYIDKLKVLFVNRQLISSKYMDLCFHYTNEIVYKDHIHARGPLGEFIYDLDNEINDYRLYDKKIQIKYFK